MCYPWVIQELTNPSSLSLHPGSKTPVFLGERACPQTEQSTACQWYCQQATGCPVWTPVNNPYHYLHCITPRVLLLPLPLTELFLHLIFTSVRLSWQLFAHALIEVNIENG